VNKVPGGGANVDVLSQKTSTLSQIRNHDERKSVGHKKECLKGWKGVTLGDLELTVAKTGDGQRTKE